MDDLTEKKCVPCEGGVPPLNSEQVAEYRKQTPDWDVLEDEKSISREFLFGNFKEALVFVNKVGELAEAEGHHPDIAIHDYKYVSITLSTHAIGGLSENDFILAAKIDRVR